MSEKPERYDFDRVFRLLLTVAGLLGVIWLLAYLSDVLVPSGAQVEPGNLLVRMRSPALENRIAVLEADSRIMNIRMAVALRDNPVQLDIIAEESAAIAAELEQLHQQREALTVRSSQSGVFVCMTRRRRTANRIHLPPISPLPISKPY